MKIADILLQDFDAAISNNRRTLERVPEDKGEWVPHPKSMKLGKLAMHCATLPLFGYYILEDEGMDMANSQRERIPPEPGGQRGLHLQHANSGAAVLAGGRDLHHYAGS